MGNGGDLGWSQCSNAWIGAKIKFFADVFDGLCNHGEMKGWLANAHSTAIRPLMPEARLQEHKQTSPFRASQMKKSENHSG